MMVIISTSVVSILVTIHSWKEINYATGDFCAPCFYSKHTITKLVAEAHKLLVKILSGAN